MPSQHGVDMPNDCQAFVVIESCKKSSTMNKPEKRLG